MKSALLTLAFAVLAFIPQSFAMDNAMTPNKTAKVIAKVTAVSFHSDSCGACKILGPQMKKALTAINMEQVDIVKFDFTNKETIAATRALASEKGVNKTLQSYGAKTGFIVLLDKDGNEVNKLKVDDNAADIAVKITKAIIDQS